MRSAFKTQWKTPLRLRLHSTQHPPRTTYSQLLEPSQKMTITPLYGFTLALISVGLWHLCKRIFNKPPLTDIPGPPSRSWWAGTSTHQVYLLQSATDYANQVTSFRYLATTRGIFSGISQKRLDPPCVQLGSWV